MDNLSHNIRKFNRFELKYLITLKQAARFKSEQRAYLVPDEYGNNNLTILIFPLRARSGSAVASTNVESAAQAVQASVETASTPVDAQSDSLR